jgi:RimJ/RimL family protein N-acetyltransferase
MAPAAAGCENWRQVALMTTARANPDDYPHELSRAVTLKDGRKIALRAIRPDDAPRLIAMYDHLSRHTAYQRFFTVMRRLPPDWARILTGVDYRRRLALIAEHDAPSGPEIVGVGRYEPTDRDDTAEVAFVVQDAWQGQGLGTRLLLDLLAAAEARGIKRFCAWVLGDNARMLGLLARYTNIERRTIESGVVGLVFTARRPGAAGS